MSYCVLIKISREKLTFWYQRAGSQFQPLKSEEGNEIPLYFYSSGNDFIMGTRAKLLFEQNDPNAYAHYFDLITKPGFYSRMGENRQIKQLLYDGIERYLNTQFIHKVLVIHESLENLRSSLCIGFWFEQDVEEHEQHLVMDLFSEAGYNNIEKITHTEHLLEYLNLLNIQPQKHELIVLSSVSNDLYIQYYLRYQNQLKFTQCVPGYGSDPRLKMLAKLIIDNVNSYKKDLNVEREESFILSYVARFLKSYKSLIEGDIQLSTGEIAKFRIRASKLDDNVLGMNEFGRIFYSLDDLIERYNVQVDGLILVTLDPEINTEYFLQKLKSRFSVFEIDREIRDGVLEYIFKLIEHNGYKFSSYLSKNQPSIPLATLANDPEMLSEQRRSDKSDVRPALPPVPRPNIPSAKKPDSKPELPPIPRPNIPSAKKPDSKPELPPIPRPNMPSAKKPDSKPELPPIPRPNMPSAKKPDSKPELPPIPRPNMPPVIQNSGLEIPKPLTPQKSQSLKGMAKK